MLRKLSIGLLLGAAIVVSQMVFAPAASAASLKVKVDSIKGGGAVPAKYAFCVPTPDGHMGAGPNISPAISWSKGPRGTQSYAIVLFDTDSPKSDREKMNKEGMTVPTTAMRQAFYHWVLVDIPANVRSLKEGAGSNGRIAHGKPATADVGKPGVNMFTMVFANNDAMKGVYHNYDGPCPPWNDDNLHHYHFAVYALSVKSLGLTGDFDAPAALAAMKGKVLANGQFDATYTTTKALGAKVPK
ncbi:MAG: YbhB/YbcL family Raf kinase inhibitor-like protein [Pseudolabrys sp.]